jgi:hypothetical protein
MPLTFSSSLLIPVKGFCQFVTRSITFHYQVERLKYFFSYLFSWSWFGTLQKYKKKGKRIQRVAPPLNHVIYAPLLEAFLSFIPPKTFFLCKKIFYKPALASSVDLDMYHFIVYLKLRHIILIDKRALVILESSVARLTLKVTNSYLTYRQTIQESKGGTNFAIEFICRVSPW